LEYLQGQVYKINNSAGSIVTPRYKKRLPKMGFKRGLNHGDLIIEFDVRFPTQLSDDQIKTLSETL
jgi:DnaJ-class molecular chaperone